MQGTPILFATLKDGRLEALYRIMGYDDLSLIGDITSPEVQKGMEKAESNDSLTLNNPPPFIQVILMTPNQTRKGSGVSKYKENVEFALKNNPIMREKLKESFPIFFESGWTDSQTAQKIAESLSAAMNGNAASVGKLYPKWMLWRYKDLWG